ncbi:ABC transporter permease [Mycobacterium sp. NPDC003449]
MSVGTSAPTSATADAEVSGGGHWQPLRTAKPKGSWRSLKSGKNAYRLAVPIVLVVLWQVLSSAGVIPPSALDSPATVISALWDLIQTGTLQESLAVSLQRAGQGYAIGAVIGLTAGLISGLSYVGERAFDASLQMLRTIPFLAVVPLFVIWFGVGELSKVALIATACVFPIYLNTFAGVRNVDRKVVEAAEVFGLSRFATAMKIVLPLAMPTILVGLRYSLGVSLLALVAAEQINATSGIGYLALSPRAAMRTDIVLSIVLVYAVLGLAVDLVIRIVTRITVPWHQTFLKET